uniref:Complex I assembly factor TIMMDC1, mitochondrial n=1 Tax=Strongyloides venezuelensis TaxID=75913 RepID=A0A0K0FMG9_STRVS
MSDTPTVKTLTESEVKKDIPNPGLERIKAIYNGVFEGKLSFELDVFAKVTKYSFFTAFFIGGLSGHDGVFKRYNIHSEGKTFLSPRDAVKRRFDFSITMFAKRGLVHGIRATALAGSVVFFSTHFIAYRDHFSYLYFPLISGATTGILHAGTAFGVLAFPLGILGSARAVGLGLVTGGSLSAFLGLYGLCIGKSSTEMYKQFKFEYEEFLRYKYEEGSKVKQFMKDNGIFFRHMALMKLQEKENAEMLREVSSKDDI